MDQQFLKPVLKWKTLELTCVLDSTMIKIWSWGAPSFSNCQVESLEDVTSHQTFSRVWVAQNFQWPVAILRFFTFWGFLHGVWILPKVSLGLYSLAQKTLGKPRLGHVCGISNLRVGLSLHYSAIICEDDHAKNPFIISQTSGRWPLTPEWTS